MTGLERNGDVVRMASYAPLFAHVEGWQWKPDLIWVDNLRSYGTPNYYVQKLFANNAGDVLLPVKLDMNGANKFYVSASQDNATGEIILKVVNGGNASVTVKLDLAGVKRTSPSAKAFTLTNSSQQAENSFAEPRKIFPQETKIKISAPQFDYSFAANSLTVLRLKIKN
jgi:alpha-N-arabinofuranosidase